MKDIIAREIAKLKSEILLITVSCSTAPGIFKYIYLMRLQDLPGYSHILSLFTCHIYHRRFRAVIGL